MNRLNIPQTYLDLLDGYSYTIRSVQSELLHFLHYYFLEYIPKYQNKYRLLEPADQNFP